ncbi:MAG: hypothetical protein WC227_02000 [Patescibacteria group bacterium]|jgi:hypothetical protein
MSEVTNYGIGNLGLPDQNKFRVMSCGAIDREQIVSENWALVFKFNQDNLSEWNKAVDIVDQTNRKQWDVATGPDPDDDTKSAVYRRTIDPSGQLSLGN